MNHFHSCFNDFVNEASCGPPSSPPWCQWVPIGSTGGDGGAPAPAPSGDSGDSGGSGDAGWQPVCFACDTRIKSANGTMVRVGDVRPGDELYSVDGTSPTTVLATRSSRILPTEHHHLVTVRPHACGRNQPSTEVLMTRHHAIRCPGFMKQFDNIDRRDAADLYTFPDRLPSSSIRFGDVTDRVCHLDIGDPEVPLVAEGMLAESWDGRDAGVAREYEWRVYKDTPFVQRYAVELVQF